MRLFLLTALLAGCVGHVRAQTSAPPTDSMPVYVVLHTQGTPEVRATRASSPERLEVTIGAVLDTPLRSMPLARDGVDSLVFVASGATTRLTVFLTAPLPFRVFRLGAATIVALGAFDPALPGEESAEQLPPPPAVCGPESRCKF